MTGFELASQRLICSYKQDFVSYEGIFRFVHAEVEFSTSHSPGLLNPRGRSKIEVEFTPSALRDIIKNEKLTEPASSETTIF